MVSWRKQIAGESKGALSSAISKTPSHKFLQNNWRRQVISQETKIAKIEFIFFPSSHGEGVQWRAMVFLPSRRLLENTATLALEVELAY